MEDITPYLAFGSLVWTGIQFYKFIESKAWASARYQGAAWAAGVVVTMLAAQTSFAAGIPTFSDLSLAVASFWDQLFIGLTVAGVAGVAWSAKKALDNRDTDASPANK